MTKARIGDVFLIPIDLTYSGVGQVVAFYGEILYLTAFNAKISSTWTESFLSETLAKRPALLALSLDGSLYRGDWPIVSWAKPAHLELLPAYKEAVGTPDNIQVVDYSGERSRRASSEEAELLPYRKVVSSARLENALKSLHGLKPWVEQYDTLIPRDELTTRALFR